MEKNTQKDKNKFIDRNVFPSYKLRAHEQLNALIEEAQRIAWIHSRLNIVLKETDGAHIEISFKDWHEEQNQEK